MTGSTTSKLATDSVVTVAEATKRTLPTNASTHGEMTTFTALAAAK